MKIYLRAAVLAATLCVSLAFAVEDPPLTTGEKQIYHGWNQDFRLLYDPWFVNAAPIPYRQHLAVAHPRLEQQALEWAHTPGNGPHQFTQHRGAIYASTLIRGNEGPARNWNLRQNGQPPHDVNVFWKIDRRGAKMLRFDLWPAGAQAQQMLTMQDAIRHARV